MVDPTLLKKTRLHITPFNSGLFDACIPPSLQPAVSNISFHAVPTFPGGYGYLDLPEMEAQKLKKKLNGSTLKGKKVRVQEAKPDRRRKLAEETQGEETNDKAESKARKKPKSEKGVDQLQPGVELPADRRVQRGWTEVPTERRSKAKNEKESEGKSKKPKKEPSKYTREPELLFRTTLPVNAPLKITQANKEPTAKKGKSSDGGQVVVHEFGKTKKHAGFLKSNNAPQNAQPVSEYVEGRGWVNAEGKVVEPERAGKRQLRETARPAETALLVKSAKSVPPGKAAVTKPAKQAVVQDDISSDENTSSESESSLEVSSTAESDSDSDSDSNSNSEAMPEKGKPASPIYGSVTAAPAPSVATNEVLSKEPHPLETLFKRPKTPVVSNKPNPLAPLDTSFSFFGPDGAEVGADGNTQVSHPTLTPFTEQDLEWRGQRSAAPTPDTAAIGKKFSFSAKGGTADDTDEEDSDGAGAGAENISGNLADDAAIANGEVNRVVRNVDATINGGTDGQPQSEFAMWFWENRGNVNRAWKKRRREAMKAKRQRENRKIGRRIV